VIEREIPGAGALSAEQLQQGGFPADRVSEVKAIIDPTTAE
jgi:hypothetical protein